MIDKFIIKFVYNYTYQGIYKIKRLSIYQREW